MPQPRINVDIDLGLPGLPGLPTPTRPGGLPGGAAARNGAGARPAAARGASQRGTDGAHPDPVAELRFVVDLPEVGLGRFRECTGLAAEIECKDYNEGGVNDRVHKLPTRMKYPNLVLKRGVTREDALMKWLWETQRPKSKPRKNVTVTLKGPDGKSVRSWVLYEAFPIKWTGPNLNAGSNQIATETLEIVHAGIQMQMPAGK